MSIVYRFPRLYDSLVGLIHGQDLKKRYQIIGDQIGDNKRVFEIGCGTAMIVPFLHDNCTYEGWDLNENFIIYCKRKGLNVSLKNIFDFDDYPDSDIILICDLLHHLVPNHEELLTTIKTKEKTKKIIVSEPARSFKPKKIFKPFISLGHRIAGDFDGINHPDRILEWDYGEDELRNFFQRLGCTQTINVGWDMIAVFDL
jgi:SAM-dependent methyltransferase